MNFHIAVELHWSECGHLEKTTSMVHIYWELVLCVYLQTSINIYIFRVHGCRAQSFLLAKKVYI